MNRTLGVVLKTAERCNIACDYCYFFFRGDESYRHHPPVIKRPTIDSVVDFLQQGVTDLGVGSLDVVFHGGEPLLQPVADFDHMCSALREGCGRHVQTLSLHIQTNGMLVSERWLQLFKRYGVQVGISLDGPQDSNDLHRLDKRGRGTYQRTVRGLSMLQEAHRRGELAYEPVLLCVINPALDPRRMLEHFVHELGVRTLDFLLPDLNPDTFGAENVEAYARYLCTLFEVWCEVRSIGVDVRIFSAMSHRLAGQPSFLFDHVEDELQAASLRAITIGSDGTLGPDDALRSTAVWSSTGPYSIHNTTLRDFLDTPLYQEIDRGRMCIPDSCRECIWEHVCGGGSLQHRWTRESKFERRTVYCSGIWQLFFKVAADLVRRGFRVDDFIPALRGSDLQGCMTSGESRRRSA